MSHMICIQCGEVYDPLYIKSSNFDETLFCPKMSCAGPVIECDDLIMPAVYTLNRKGYKTHHSCSGHPGSRIDDTYVSFDCPVSNLDAVIEKIIDKYGYGYTAAKCEGGHIQFQVDGNVPSPEGLYSYGTRRADCENWDDVKFDFEKLKYDSISRDVIPIITVRPRVNDRGEIVPPYDCGNIKTYTVTGHAIHALYDVNMAILKMAESLPDELSLL